MELLIFDNLSDNAGVSEKNTKSRLRDVIKFAETESVTSNAGREYIVSLIANDNNILSSLAIQNKKIGDSLYNAALTDTECIFSEILPVFDSIAYNPSGNETGFYSGYRDSIKSLTSSKQPREFLDKLITHYRNFGTGIKAKYTAFKYDGALEGIASADPVSFDSLIGIDHQKNMLISNTKAFIGGGHANNVLLVGDRGTGKSSSVKALLNMFCRDGLRMAELPKQHIRNMQKLIDELSVSPHKYILFLDDLTFESGDPDYHALKISMEGQLSAMPRNVIVYATSNRRHLIKETWSEREGGEVHKNDQRQEIASLSERFGIKLVFSSPNRSGYLDIVKSLLAQKSIDMTPDIERRALIWEMNNSGFSGRCAKQFVESVIAEYSE
ncbi:MAG: ATP-binding protein [Oscillospiraceae bacterium]|nr:ATP-binding protein [Oscillospiraceae bacterium]